MEDTSVDSTFREAVMHLFEQTTLSPIRGALFAITLLATE